MMTPFLVTSSFTSRLDNVLSTRSRISAEGLDTLICFSLSIREERLSFTFVLSSGQEGEEGERRGRKGSRGDGGEETVRGEGGG